MWQVTHFVPRRPERDAWAKVTFYTRISGREGHFCGFDLRRTYSKNEMKELINDGVVEMLQLPVQIADNQLVWISPSYDVWIADKQSPLDDPARRRAKAGDPVHRQRKGAMNERVFAREYKGMKHLLTIDKKYVQNPLYSVFVKTIVAELAEAHNAQELPRPDKEPQIRWDFIASYLRNGVFDFCYDPYFRSPTRAELVDVVQFGWIREITVFVDRASPLYPGIIGLSNEGKGLRDTLIALASDHKLEIGVLGECAATSEIYELLSDKLGVFSCINSMRDEIEMRGWIEDDSGRRIIVGDIGLVPMLLNVTSKQIKDSGRDIPKDFGKRNFAANDKYTRFNMTEPHPVGFVCIRDERWQNDIRQAFVKALWIHRTDIPWEGKGQDTLVTMLAEVGVEAFSLKELLERLGWPKVYDLMLAEKNEDYEKAAELRDHIKELNI